MNIEKTECDRLGYEYKNLLEQVVYALHHIPYAKDFISEEKLKKLDDLSLKLSTGNCEIIEFKRTLCKYNFTDILKEKDKERDRLNNIINELKWKPIEEYDKSNYDWVLVKYFDGDYECVPCVAEKRFGKWYSIDEKEIQFDVKYFMDMQQLDKLKELKENNKDV